MKELDEYFKISSNALKVMYFEAMVMHEMDEVNKEQHKIKLSVGGHIYSLAAEEKNVSLMLMVLDAANITDDLVLVGKASTWLANNTEASSEHINSIANAVGYIAKDKDVAIQYALQAGMNIREGFDELGELALLVTDEPYTLNNLMH